MKLYLVASVLLVGLQAVTAGAEVRVNVNVGGPPAMVVAPPPLTVPPPLVFATPPSFIYSPALGFYVSVDQPADIVYIGRAYYRYSSGAWYRASHISGPWAYLPAGRLPPRLERHRYEEIRRYRDEEYRRYMHDRGHYRGRWHRPEEERKEVRREVRRDHRADRQDYREH